MSGNSQDVFARLDRERERHVEELKDYLRIPSISTDPAYRAEVERCADWLIARMKEAGLATEKIATAGHPLVYAEWTGAGPDKPTVLFYGHYDVQPPDPLEEWRNPPFEPTARGRLLVARGATDDKGQSYAHVKGVAAMLAERGKLPVNVKFIVEGEEEAGGEAIEAFVRDDRGGKLACDCVVVSDTSMYAPGVPALTYGLKGLAYFEIRVAGPNRDLHSGVYGGGVTNPAQRARRDRRLAARLAHRQDPGPRLLRRRPPARRLGAQGVRRARPSTRRRSRRPGRDRAHRRGGLHLPRAHLGAADLRRQRSLVRLPGQGRQDRAAGARRLQGLVPAGRRPDPGEGRRAGQGARRAGRAARRQGRGRVPARRRRGDRRRHRADRRDGARRDGRGLRPAAGAHPHRRLDPDRRHLRAGARGAGAADGLRPRGRPPALAQREVRPRQLPRRNPHGGALPRPAGGRLADDVARRRNRRSSAS